MLRPVARPPRRQPSSRPFSRLVRGLAGGAVLTLLALGPACNTPQSGGDGGSATVVSTRSGILVTGPTLAARYDGALAAVQTVAITSKGADTIRKVKADVAVDAPKSFSGLPEGVNVLDISKEPAIRAALEGTDDKAAAEAIRAKGAKTLVIHYDIGPSLDRDKKVLSRLYHHDDLTYFQLVRVEDGAFIYLVVDAPLTMKPEVAGAAMTWVRQRLHGDNPPPFPPLKPERSNWTLVASLRGQGQELAFSLAEADTLDKALNEVASDLEAMYRRQREPLGFPRLDKAIDGLTLEIHRVTERAEVVPRDDKTLTDLWEMGVDGAILLDIPTDEERKSGKKGQSGVWPGSVASTRGITSPDSFLRGIAKEFRWDSTRPWRDEGTKLELIRTQHYMEAATLPTPKVAEAHPIPQASIPRVIPMYRGETVVPMDSVNLTTVKDAVVLAGEWYLANLRPDGSVTYKMWPEENRYANEYNHVRHTLATWNLWEAWTLDPRPEFLEGAIRAQNWTLKSVGEKDGMAFMTYGGQTKLGSVVVALLGMIEVAKAQNDHSHDDLMRKFGKFILFMQQDDGKFRGYWNPADGSFPDQVNDIVPGEAALALVYLSQYFDDPSYLEAIPKFFAHYKPWFEERAARKNAGSPWPAYTYNNDDRLELVQFGPWTVMAASAYTKVKPDAHDVAEFGLKVGKWMIDSYEYTEDNAPFPDYVGGYYKFEGELPAMQAFCYGEGVSAAYDMALRMDPSQSAYFEKHARETVRFAFQMQHDGIDSRFYSRPMEVMGGIKYAMNEPKIRIDYVHHALSAMYQWLMAARTDPNLPASAKAEPDDDLRGYMRLADMPSARAPGAFVRTAVPSVPSDTITPQGANGTGPAWGSSISTAPVAEAPEKGDDGGE